MGGMVKTSELETVGFKDDCKSCPILETESSLIKAGDAIKQDDSTRPYIYLVFLVFTAIILPVWWSTTSVPRSALEFPAWNSKPELALKRLACFTLWLVDFEEKEQWNNLIDTELRLGSSLSANDLEESNFDDKVKIVVKRKGLSGHASSSFEELVDYHFKLGDETTDSAGQYQVVLLGSTSVPSNDNPIWFHPKRRVVVVSQPELAAESFADPQAYLKNLSIKILSTFSKKSDHDNDDHSKSLIADSPRYQVSITLVVGQYENSLSVNGPYSWEIERAASKYLEPLISQLASIADFSVTFQIKNYAPFSPAIEADGKFFTLRQDSLANFVDENRWNVGSTTLDATLINFLIFLPPLSMQPLKLQDSDNFSFSYAQWGSVYILNNKKGHSYSDIITEADLALPMRTFARHLKKFFGMESDNNNSLATMLPFDADRLLLKLFTRRYDATKTTLMALQRLLNEYTEIAVLSSIVTLVKEALERLKLSESLLALSKWDAALLHVTMAVQYADAAFFHPSMMAHQYFPQEHKLGVYMPLFFPFVLPMAISTLVGLFSWLKFKKSTTSRSF